MEKTTIVLERIMSTGISNFGGKVKGQKYTRCVFRCIDKNSKFVEQRFLANIYLEYDYIDELSGENLEFIAHYIIKRNLIAGVVFENVELYESKNTPVNESRYKILLNHFNTGVVVHLPKSK